MLTFGIPIILNPLLLVPFVLTPVVCYCLAYAATVCGFLPNGISLFLLFRW